MTTPHETTENEFPRMRKLCKQLGSDVLTNSLGISVQIHMAVLFVLFHMKSYSNNFLQPFSGGEFKGDLNYL